MSRLAIPVRIEEGLYAECPKEEATHVRLRLPGWVGLCCVPFRPPAEGKGSGPCWWIWNGSEERPTLSPSLLSRSGEWRCHCFVRNGKALFLNDCTHEFAGRTVDLLPVEEGG